MILELLVHLWMVVLVLVQMQDLMQQDCNQIVEVLVVVEVSLDLAQDSAFRVVIPFAGIVMQLVHMLVALETSQNL